MENVTFDEAAHTYTSESGRALPSVTRLLKSAGLIEERWSNDEAMKRGTYAHKALEFYDQGDLDETGLDAGLLPYLEAWKRLRDELPFEILAVEERVLHPTYLYAGTLDRRVKLKVGGLAVIDIKTGMKQPWHSLQLALYSMCFVEPMRRFSAYLNDGGTYSLVEYTDRNDFAVAKAVITLHNFKKGNGL